MAERSKAAVLKIARPRKGSHGFESHSLRCCLPLDEPAPRMSLLMMRNGRLVRTLSDHNGSHVRMTGDNGKFESVMKHMLDVVSGVVSGGYGRVWIDRDGHRDVELVALPTNFQVGDVSDSIDSQNRRLCDFDQFGFDSIQQPSGYRTSGSKKEPENDHRDDQASHGVDPIGSERGAYSSGDHGQGGEGIGACVLSVGNECFGAHRLSLPGFDSERRVRCQSHQ